MAEPDAETRWIAEALGPEVRLVPARAYRLTDDRTSLVGDGAFTIG